MDFFGYTDKIWFHVSGSIQNFRIAVEDNETIKLIETNPCMWYERL